MWPAESGEFRPSAGCQLQKRMPETLMKGSVTLVRGNERERRRKKNGEARGTPRNRVCRWGAEARSLWPKEKWGRAGDGQDVKYFRNNADLCYEIKHTRRRWEVEGGALGQKEPVEKRRPTRCLARN
ncbi:hypothetical protein KM043_006988 [Ampulex compressa]|nr:hypothetical protein KM043_006988 [Ampulex compressa]